MLRRRTLSASYFSCEIPKLNDLRSRLSLRPGPAASLRRSASSGGPNGRLQSVAARPLVRADRRTAFLCRLLQLGEFDKRGTLVVKADAQSTLRALRDF